jgi:hypothetical protein
MSRMHSGATRLFCQRRQLVVSLESARDVAGVEDCDTRRLREAIAERGRRHWANRTNWAEVGRKLF